MKVDVVYVYPNVNARTYFGLADRFARTWLQNPPGYDCTLHVVHNGGPHPAPEMRPFDPIVHFDVIRSNLGWDIGAFQYAAEALSCDLLVCLGAPVHFHRGQWLESMVDAYINHGPALYGCWGYLYPNWHIRTTVFWCPPQLIQSYPYDIGSTRQSRYGFEHGPNSFTRHVMSAGFDTIMVTRKGCFPFSRWANNVPGVEDSLVLDQHIHQ